MHGGKVQRIHFTFEDLARVQVGNSLGPIAETIFAIDLFEQGRSTSFNTWRKQVRHQVRKSPIASKFATQQTRRLSNLLWMLERPGEMGQGVELVQEFFQMAVAPYWQQVQNLLEEERDARSRIVATGGVELLLSTLRPKVTWRPPVLEIASEQSGDIHLDGNGLLLSPSLFLADNAVLIESERETGRSVLVFAMPLDRTTAAPLWGARQTSDQALAALVGRTRAAGLQAITDVCTTGELAQRLGISVAGASQHAAVLREAGLITTRRNRNAVLHAVTPLGAALLAGRLSSAAS
jgi:DNA-binding transcriptional ArsR family regulator